VSSNGEEDVEEVGIQVVANEHAVIAFLHYYCSFKKREPWANIFIVREETIPYYCTNSVPKLWKRKL
jgi:protein associated with RNAse G/E